MERGELGISAKPGLVFVFEDLIAHCGHPRVEKGALRAHQWGVAVDQWVFDVQVRSYIQRMIDHYGVPIDVLTWRPIGFAEALHDRLWHYDMQVRSTRSVEYSMVSPQMATDPAITTVYDADPEHRFGYGFKAREFNLGQL
jgi:hypothetical protein